VKTRDVVSVSTSWCRDCLRWNALHLGLGAMHLGVSSRSCLKRFLCTSLEKPINPNPKQQSQFFGPWMVTTFCVVYVTEWEEIFSTYGSTHCPGVRWWCITSARWLQYSSELSSSADQSYFWTWSYAAQRWIWFDHVVMMRLLCQFIRAAECWRSSVSCSDETISQWLSPWQTCIRRHRG